MKSQDMYATVGDCREMLKTDPSTVHSKLNSAKTISDIKQTFCVLAEGCLGSTSV